MADSPQPTAVKQDGGAKAPPSAPKDKKSLATLVPESRASKLAATVRAEMKDPESIQLIAKGDIVKIASISTGSLGLDVAIGIGGLPQGRIVEIYGSESSGKTTIALQAVAACQAAGGVASFIDAEHALDPTYAMALGVKLEDLLLSQPSNGEEALSICEILTRNGKPGDLVVVDSVAALTPQAEIDGEMGQAHMGLLARLMGQGLRKITSFAHNNGVTVLFINQLRMKLGVVFGSPETQPGGRALPFYASVRLDIRRISGNKVGDEVVSNRTKVKVVKNKVAPPFKTVEFDIRFGTGVDYRSEMLEFGELHGIIEKAGSWYSYKQERIANGKEAAIQALMANPELDQKIYKAVREAVFAKK